MRLTLGLVLFDLFGPLIVVGATLRLTRLVNVDTFFSPVRDPILSWAEGHPRREFWAEGLECPFCIGFWIGLAVVGSYVWLGDTLAWWIFFGALALNYLTGHLSSRLEYGDD